MNHSSLLSELSLDFETFSPESVSLSETQIDEALSLSHTVQTESRQWYTYLNALALFGFENWLEERGNFSINRENCSIFNPEISNIIEAVCHLEVNQFQVCLITVGSLFDEVVTVPQAVLDLPEYAAQFYVLVKVQEELETVSISGFVSYPDLIAAKAKVNLEADEDWTYQVPLQWFEQDINPLLLYFRCLEPGAIVLPEAVNRQTLLATNQAELQQILPRIQAENSSNSQLWNLLTWEQGIAVLTHPQLLKWVYQIQNSTQLEQETNPSALIQTRKNHLSDIFQLLTEPAINLGRWLQDELDNLASELSWVMIPEFSTPTAMRSLRFASEEFDTIERELKNKKIEIPPDAKGASRDLQLADTSLRLYVLSWELDSDSVREWKLLLILGTPSRSNLPHQVQLRVSDETQILAELSLNPGDDYPYIYTEVEGSLEEKFIVTISLGGEIQETLPPFGFNPEQ